VLSVTDLRRTRGAGQPVAYSALICSAYCLVTMSRRTLSDGVSCPLSTVNSSARIANFLIASALDTARLA
jgi:hypothetical protein